jgi:hypothetical protein
MCPDSAKFMVNSHPQSGADVWPATDSANWQSPGTTEKDDE